MSMFSDPVYDDGFVPVSYNAKNTFCNSVITPMQELPL